VIPSLSASALRRRCLVGQYFPSPRRQEIVAAGLLATEGSVAAEIAGLKQRIELLKDRQDVSDARRAALGG
jgi:hypothetical protein